MGLRQVSGVGRGEQFQGNGKPWPKEMKASAPITVSANSWCLLVGRGRDLELPGNFGICMPGSGPTQVELFSYIMSPACILGTHLAVHSHHR